MMEKLGYRGWYNCSDHQKIMQALREAGYDISGSDLVQESTIALLMAVVEELQEVKAEVDALKRL